MSPATFIKRLATGVLVINLFVVALTGLSLRQSQLQHEERAAITTQNLSQVLEQYIGDSISKIDVILLITADEIEKQMTGGGINARELNPFIVRQRTCLPELDGLRVADALGNIIYGTDMAAAAQKSIADREYFNRLRDDSKAGLIISKPVISRVTGKWSLILARRVNRWDGSFAGAVYGVISLEHFQKLFASIDVGKYGSITLRDADLGVVVRHPKPQERGSAVGQKIVSDKFRELIKSGRNSGTYKSQYPVDKIERTYTYRRISKYPLYINVGLATDYYLAGWREEISKMSAVAIFFFLITLFTSWVIYHDWKRRKAAVQVLAQQEKKFRTIADYTYDWEFWLAPDNSFVHTSPSCKRITGCDAQEFYADPGLLSRIVHPDDLEKWSVHRHEARSGIGTDCMVFRIRRADGAIRWLEHVCQPVVDEEGTFLGTRGSNRDITERKQAETKLHEQFLFLRQLLDAIPIPVFYKDIDGLYLGCNSAYATFIGLPKDQLLGKSAYDLAPKELADTYHEADSALYRQPGEQVYENSVLHVDGTRHDVIFNKATYVNADGEVSGIVGAIMDVTQSKNVEEALWRRNRALKSLTNCNETLVRAENESDLLHDICRIITEDGEYSFAWVGYTENDEARTLRSVVHAGCGPEYLDNLNISWADNERGMGPTGTAIRTGQPCLTKDIKSDASFALWRDQAIKCGYRSSLAVPLVFNTQVLGAINIYASKPDAFDAEELELMVQLANDLAYGIISLRTREKHIQSVNALMESVQEYQKLANAFNQKQSLLRALIDSIPDLIFYKDNAGAYLGCNKAFEAFAGLTEEGLIGFTDLEIFPQEADEFFREMDRQMLSQRKAHRYEKWVDYPDGRRILQDTLKTPYYDHDGKLLGLIGVSRDITEQRMAEEERKNLETQLNQAQKMEAIGQLAGGIAHDFNNILTAIVGYSEIILLRLEKGNPLRYFAEQVLASAERAEELTHGLLAFSRKQVIHTKPIDLCEVVREVKKMLIRLVPEDIEFHSTFVERNLIVMADKGQIEQVLMNLVTNARDAMPKGGSLAIDVSYSVMDEKFVHAHGFGEPGCYACISVTDTGQGMDKDTSKKIFEPFFTTKEVGKGTGLGMAIIYGIVKQHNGYINVYSETGIGTTFRIYLPLINGEVEQTQKTRNIELPTGGNETILLAEDDAMVRELHGMILADAGYTVIEATNGQDALEKLIKCQAAVDILVSDVIMPKMDGKKLYEEIKKLRPDMKVLFMSGYTKDIVIERGIIDDEVSFITKPVMPSELLIGLRKILDRN